MKTKPILIILAAIILVVGTFFLVRSKNSDKPGKDEINQFLNGFNNRIKEGNTDSLMAYFETHKKLKILKRLVNLLEGKRTINGKEKPVFDLSLDVDASTIKIISPDLVTASIPVKFSHDSLNSKQSTLILKIHKIAPHKFKIMQIDTRQLLIDYVAYENYVRSKTVPDKDIYSPITLAAFKATEQLKVRYDSVIWFDHINNQTYFYVKIGKIDDDFYLPDYLKESTTHTCQFGLVNPNLKEIIPPKYDLIHNVSGTIVGLVEVEKGSKKGFYNLNGKIIVPVDYDQLFPLKDGENLALLRKDDEYFYLKKDSSITDKIAGFKIADALPQIKTFGDSYSLSEKSSKNIMEYNSHEKFTSLVVPPSYLVDLLIVPKFLKFRNPLRHSPDGDEVEDGGDGSLKWDVKYNGIQNNDQNWFEIAFYSVINNFVDGRSGLYDNQEIRKVVMVDKKQNRLLVYEPDENPTGSGQWAEKESDCNENNFRAVNDTVFEYKTTSSLSTTLTYGEKFLASGPNYYYLHIENGKLVALPNKRTFGCTKYVKMDDSYMYGCFAIYEKKVRSNTFESKTVDHMTPEILQYMKNEIYASYGYKFKTKQWSDIFDNQVDLYTGDRKANIDDSLTEIDKYNIQWINSKLNNPKANTLASK